MYELRGWIKSVPMFKDSLVRNPWNIDVNICLYFPNPISCIIIIFKRLSISKSDCSQVFQAGSDKNYKKNVQIIFFSPIFIIVWVKKYFLAFLYSNLTLPDLNISTPSLPESRLPLFGHHQWRLTKRTSQNCTSSTFAPYFASHNVEQTLRMKILVNPINWYDLTTLTS